MFIIFLQTFEFILASSSLSLQRARELSALHTALQNALLHARVTALLCKVLTAPYDHVRLIPSGHEKEPSVLAHT